MEPSEQRSRNMRAVRATDIEPEMTVRRMVHGMGYRYRLHRKDLPGKPDLVFAKLRKVIFVHGCFWHGHDCTRGTWEPKTNTDYWRTKIGRNRQRDSASLEALAQKGWRAAVVWECELRTPPRLKRRLAAFLNMPATQAAHG